eukprot:TRINITY_DN11048_c0_g1_i1.p1 TRINITY_DN11048_c0_g1~~TRINITY_DN11048_c0_g1_i1.p1  ORF type:complete len:240 (+),score=38.59 TRINITY_DN11048_c0_g1_i1:97-816(+)
MGASKKRESVTKSGGETPASTDILLYNVTPNKTYDKTFKSNFASDIKRSTINATYASSDTAVDVDSLEGVKLRLVTPRKMFSRVPNFRRLQKDFRGVDGVIAFFDQATVSSLTKLESILNNNIRPNITKDRTAVAFVLDSQSINITEPTGPPKHERELMEHFCAENNVIFLCIDLKNSEQVCAAVRRLTADISSGEGVTPKPRVRNLAPTNQAFPQLLIQPKTVTSPIEDSIILYNSEP